MDLPLGFWILDETLFFVFDIQWNPVNMVTNGLKKIWPYYRGRLKFHDLRAVMTNAPYIKFTVLFLLINNRNVDIAYNN